MEIVKTSIKNFEQKSDAKIEGNPRKPRERVDETSISSDDLTSRTRGGSRKSTGRRRGSKKRESVYALEVEETKGFMDLGFVFTKEDLNSELPEILPGLRTFLCREEQRRIDMSVPRPYLSETWDLYSDKWCGKTDEDSMVIDFNMAKSCGENNIKESIKWWARSVASKIK